MLPPSQLAMLLQAEDSPLTVEAPASSGVVTSTASNKSYDAQAVSAGSSINASSSSSTSSSASGSSNGSAKSERAPRATKDKREIERYARSSLELGPRRVFLLGEQRWEDPDRVAGGEGEGDGKEWREEDQGEEEEEGVNGVVAEGGGKWRFLEIREDGGEGEVVVKSKTMVALCFQCRGEGTVVCMGE